MKTFLLIVGWLAVAVGTIDGLGFALTYLLGLSDINAAASARMLTSAMIFEPLQWIVSGSILVGVGFMVGLLEDLRSYARRTL